MEPIFGFSAEELMGSTDEVVEKLLRAVLSHLGPNARKARGVVLQDYLKGRYTEVDFLSGVVAKKGKETNIPTPANDAVVEINNQIRLGLLKPERFNLQLVREMLPQ